MSKKKHKKTKTQEIAVCALIFDSNYRILSVSRKNDISDYGLIGGKIENNELLVDGLIREVKEETGLDVIKHTLLWERMDDKYKVFTFICQCKGKINSKESGLIRWLNQDEIEVLIRGSFGNYNKQLFEYILDNPDKYSYDDYISKEIQY